MKDFIELFVIELILKITRKFKEEKRIEVDNYTTYVKFILLLIAIITNIILFTHWWECDFTAINGLVSHSIFI